MRQPHVASNDDEEQGEHIGVHRTTQDKFMEIIVITIMGKTWQGQHIKRDWGFQQKITHCKKINVERVL
jgi:hypothetical protein